MDQYARADLRTAYNSVLEMSYEMRKRNSASYDQELSEALTSKSVFFRDLKEKKVGWEASHGVKESLRQGKYGQATVRAVFGTMNLLVIPALTEVLIKGGVPDVDDEDEMDGFLKDVGQGAAGLAAAGFPAVRGLLSFFSGSSQGDNPTLTGVKEWDEADRQLEAVYRLFARRPYDGKKGQYDRIGK